MGDIVKHITELLESGNNFETRRKVYKPIGCNWFDAVFGEGEEIERCAAATGNTDAGIQAETTIDGKQNEGKVMRR